MNYIKYQTPTQTIIDGIYEDGKVILGKNPPRGVKAKVKVVFEEISEAPSLPKRRPFGIAKGTIQLSPDFDDPLEDLKDYM